MSINVDHFKNASFWEKRRFYLIQGWNAMDRLVSIFVYAPTKEEEGVLKLQNLFVRQSSVCSVHE